MNNDPALIAADKRHDLRDQRRQCATVDHHLLQAAYSYFLAG